MTTLQIVFVVLASGLILFWLIFGLQGPRKMDVPDVLVVLRYGSVLRVLALVLALTPPALMIYIVCTFAWRNDTVLAGAGVLFLLTGILAGLLLIDVERTQIALTEDGLTRDSPWTGRSALKWSAVERIHYSPLNRWLVVAGAGQTIRISRHLVGVGAFVKTARRKIGAERYASAAAIFAALSEPEA